MPALRLGRSLERPEAVAQATTYLLLGTAVATAVFHTLIPDHWLPFVLVGRARGWSARRTGLVSGLSAVIHAVLSIALGLGALALGLESARLLGHRLERASALLLIGFGLAYAAWAWRKGGHFHPGGETVHAQGEPAACEGAEGDSGDHLHYHADRGLIRGTGRGAWFLALIVGINPCVLILPILLATAQRGAAAVAVVTAAYALTTVALMVGLSMAGVAGTRAVRLPGVARHMETASGVAVAVLGSIVWWLE